MRIVIFLLLLLTPLYAVTVSYAPDDLSFTFRDDSISYSSAGNSLAFRSSVLKAGSISGGNTSWLLSPFAPASFSADGLLLGDESASLFMLFSPSFAAGWSLSFSGFSVSLAYTGRGDVSSRLFLPAEARGGAEGLHISSEYEHEYFSLFAKLSLTEELGFDVMGRASVSYGGITFAWSEGSAAAYGEDRGSLRRKLELEIRGGGLRYTSFVSYGHDPYLSGSYRFHSGREKVTLDIAGLTLAASHSASFSSEGRYSQSSRYTVSWRSFTLGFNSSLRLLASYDDGFFLAEYEEGDFFYGISLELEILQLELGMSSDGTLSSRLTLLL